MAGKLILAVLLLSVASSWATPLFASLGFNLGGLNVNKHISIGEIDRSSVQNGQPTPMPLVNTDFQAVGQANIPDGQNKFVPVGQAVFNDGKNSFHAISQTNIGAGIGDRSGTNNKGTKGSAFDGVTLPSNTWSGSITANNNGLAIINNGQWLNVNGRGPIANGAWVINNGERGYWDAHGVWVPHKVLGTTEAPLGDVVNVTLSRTIKEILEDLTECADEESNDDNSVSTVTVNTDPSEILTMPPNQIFPGQQQQYPPGQQYPPQYPQYPGQQYPPQYPQYPGQQYPPPQYPPQQYPPQQYPPQQYPTGYPSGPNFLPQTGYWNQYPNTAQAVSPPVYNQK